METDKLDALLNKISVKLLEEEYSDIEIKGICQYIREAYSLGYEAGYDVGREK